MLTLKLPINSNAKILQEDNGGIIFFAISNSAVRKLREREECVGVDFDSTRLPQLTVPATP